MLRALIFVWRGSKGQAMAVVGKDAKQPHEILDWDVDYSDWMPDGDGIEDVDVQVRLLTGSGAPALSVEGVDVSRYVVKVWLAGGAHGGKWRVQVRAITTGGRRKEAEFDISVKEV